MGRLTFNVDFVYVKSHVLQPSQSTHKSSSLDRDIVKVHDAKNSASILGDWGSTGSCTQFQSFRVYRLIYSRLDLEIRDPRSAQASRYGRGANYIDLINDCVLAVKHGWLPRFSSALCPPLVLLRSQFLPTSAVLYYI